MRGNRSTSFASASLLLALVAPVEPAGAGPVEARPDFLGETRPRARLLLLGTFHFDDPGLDSHKPEHGFAVSQVALNHPGGAYGYRVAHGSNAVVFIPDNEIDPPGPVTASFDDLADFCRGADVLIHDAQYRVHELPAKAGWGHSALRRVCDLARAAEVRHLVPYHHDPDRTDDQLDAMQDEAREWLADTDIVCTFAYEGLRFDLE